MDLAVARGATRAVVLAAMVGRGVPDFLLQILLLLLFLLLLLLFLLLLVIPIPRRQWAEGGW